MTLETVTSLVTGLPFQSFGRHLGKEIPVYGEHNYSLLRVSTDAFLEANYPKDMSNDLSLKCDETWRLHFPSTIQKT